VVRECVQLVGVPGRVASFRREHHVEVVLEYVVLGKILNEVALVVLLDMGVEGGEEPQTQMRRERENERRTNQRV
jgi:hypothetical protein